MVRGVPKDFLLHIPFPMILAQAIQAFRTPCSMKPTKRKGFSCGLDPFLQVEPFPDLELAQLRVLRRAIVTLLKDGFPAGRQGPWPSIVRKVMRRVGDAMFLPLLFQQVHIERDILEARTMMVEEVDGLPIELIPPDARVVGAA